MSLLIVISGPSGVGKDTVAARLLEVDPRLRKVATATTRAPRPGEIHGRDHLFVSEGQFKEMVSHGELLEHALVYGHWYGVPRAQVLDFLKQGYDVLLRTDVQGAASIKKLMPQALLIFIAPESMEELARRLDKRGSVDPQDRGLRLKAARQEMEAANSFDYVVVNAEGRLEETIRSIRSVLANERPSRRARSVGL